jgi:hypothetical protein
VASEKGCIQIQNFLIWGYFVDFAKSLAPAQQGLDLPFDFGAPPY